MQTEKIIRQIDSLGRVVIPKDLRLELDLECGDEIAFETEDNRIVITKPVQKCVFCKSKHNLKSFCEKFVCEECLKMLGREHGVSSK